MLETVVNVRTIHQSATFAVVVFTISSAKHLTLKKINALPSLVVPIHPLAFWSAQTMS